MITQTKILIADDAAVNRKVLVKILSPEYTVIEAENGREALEQLRKNGETISAVILDLVMPVMDGFAVLRAVQEMDAYKNLPIIVATGKGGEEPETDALKLGAWDFITKPYNAEIIKFRLRNAIDRSQLSAFNQLKYLAEYDALTGIYNKAKFFGETRKMLNGNPENKYAFLRMDIDRFQLINSFFGIEEGDRLLRFLADALKRHSAQEYFTFGRMAADVFAVCLPYQSEEAVSRFLKTAREDAKAYNSSFYIVPVFGVYYIDDPSLPVSEMLDRAELAAKTCKGTYSSGTAIYTPELRRNLEKEQEIINESVAALEQNQFCAYLQPKYSLSTNRPAGAEALVRWFHPKKGLISPGEFIQIFEKNGFIAQLDYFVWESVCRLLQDWQAQGVPLFPVSVNVSRVNLYNPNLVDIMQSLIQKYRISPKLLQLELTESAYMDSPQVMEQVVSRLHDAGFTVLMDDFGSGYSSLSVLKDVDVNALKIDMRFFEKTHVSGRGENIIASIVRMAKWLNLPVTAEGVETREQIDFLRSVGCDYVQGFYFSRPIPAEDYTRMIREKKDASQAEIYPVRYAGLDLDRLWSLDPEMLLLFSDNPSPEAICEFNGRELEVLRINIAYKTQFGFGAGASDTSPLNFIVPEHHDSVLNCCRLCVEKQETQTCEYRRATAEGRLLWIRLTLQYVQQMGVKHILMAYIEDATELKLLEARYREAISQGAATRGLEADGLFSVSAIRALLAYLARVFDVARLVDPQNTAVVTLSDTGAIIDQPYTCFQVWGKGTRCENCASIRAVRDDCRMSKYEYIQNELFYVVTNPIQVEDGLGGKHTLVLELVSRVATPLALGRENEQTIKRMIEETRRKIYTDVLTGAFNRRYLSELLFSHRGEKCVSSKLGLVMLDLRRFKRVNDQYGHESGDTLLAETARKLMRAVRPTDSVIRYGGDEFVVTLTGYDEAGVQSAVAQMRSALNENEADDQRVAVQADFGYAYTDHFDDTYAMVQKMLRVADAAMYREKVQG